MNGNSVLIDTNIALYLLNGNEQLANRLDGEKVYVSFITELELMGYTQITDREKRVIQEFLASCTIVDINEPIKRFTIALKQQHRIKLPDAIIAATARHLNIPLLTADKGFLAISEIELRLLDV